MNTQSATNSLVELKKGNLITALLSNPAEKHNYYFDVEANQPVILSLTAPPQAYVWHHYKVEYPLPKPGPVDAHTIKQGVEFATTSMTFAETEKVRFYLSIARANQSVLPNAGYTIGISSK